LLAITALQVWCHRFSPMGQPRGLYEADHIIRLCAVVVSACHHPHHTVPSVLAPFRLQRERQSHI
jgi:hypothetical protein